MKAKYFTLLLLLFFVGCKTQKSSLEQSYSHKLEALNTKLDSIFEVNLSLIEELESKTNKQSTRLVLTPIIDSNGLAIPIEYKEKRNGVTTREISLKGGALEETNEAEEKETKKTTVKDSLARSKRSQSDFALTDASDSSLDFSDESEPTQGSFWARFKLWIIIILLLVLLFLSWRLKLFRQ